MKEQVPVRAATAGSASEVGGWDEEMYSGASSQEYPGWVERGWSGW